MRFFFRRRIPPIERVLVIESGDRAVTERLMPLMRRNHGKDIVFDLVTCFPGLPEGCAPSTPVFRTYECTERRALVRELRARRYDVLAILCSGEPILLKWKCILAASIPAKVFIVNENADYFPLDYSNARLLFRLALDRTGLSGPSAGRNIAALATFPFAVAYLLLYAAWVHTRRAVRCAFR